jgi:hypothetical protein
MGRNIPPVSDSVRPKIKIAVVPVLGSNPG